MLSTLQWVSPLDLFALGLTLLSMLTVSKAKLDLSKHHTWAGYCLRTSKLLAKGTYAYIRHPLYTGIFLFIFGLLLTIVPHSIWQLTLAVVTPLSYAMIFLLHSEAREIQILAEALGNGFLAYKHQVYFCLPLRRYVEPAN